ncbi:MAG: ATP-binding protein [Candidatus Pseudobacter hemicellulosilyticus]|uniref:ATP-binding protein n=1 Tax=Candidatus Pseudobacter hemicellulosilyticus TaxID=3121375 RepID=A0AAJ5WSL0_9BACT|nr:MAG: ATP-binding protein [Pseudobacter sp.]
MHFYRFSFILISSLLLRGFLFANDTLRYEMINYTDENGLPQNSVKAFGRDQLGFVWIATENGLVRFSGHSTRVYDKSNSAITSSRFLTITRGASRGQLLAIPEQGPVLGIEGGRAARAAIANGNAYLYGHLPGVDTLVRYASAGIPDYFPDRQPARRYLLPVNDSSFYAVSDSGIYYHRPGAATRLLSNAPAPHADYFLLNNRLFRFSGTTVFLLSNGLQALQWTGDLPLHPHFKKGALRLFWNHLEQQAFIYLEGDWYLLDPTPEGQLHTRLVLRHFDADAQLIANVFFDTEKLLFMAGSRTKGFFVFRRKQFFPMRGKAGNPNAFYALTALNDHQVLTPQGDVFDAEGWQGQLPAVRQRIPLPDSYSLLTDRKGQLWIKNRHFVCLFSADGRQLLQEWSFPREVAHVYEGQDGRIWVATRQEGLYFIDPQLPGRPLQLTGNATTDISFLLQRDSSQLWIGSARGLFLASAGNGQPLPFNELAGKYIRSLYQDAQQCLWITTYDDGLFLYRSGKLFRLPADYQRYLGTAHCILEDRQGYCWITANKGLFQVRKQDLLDYVDNKRSQVHYQYYGRESGFFTNEFNGGCQPCAVSLQNGMMALPSLDGIVWFNPGRTRPELPDGPLLIENLEIDGQPVVPGDTLRLRKRFSQLRCTVVTPFWGHANNLQIEYALVSGNGQVDWLPVVNNQLVLAGPGGGTHQLLIRKKNGFAGHGETVHTILLQLPKAWFESGWFWLGWLGVTLLGFWGYGRFRTHILTRRNRQLKERTGDLSRELEGTLGALSVTEKKLMKQASMQEYLIASIAHDIKSPLRFFALTGEMLLGDLQAQPAIKPSSLRKAANMLGSARSMYYSVDNMVQYIRFQSHTAHISLVELDLQQLVTQRVDIFAAIAKEKGLILDNRVPDNFKVISEPDVLGIIVHNLVDNAIKASAEGTITVSAERTGTGWMLEFTDEGYGMPAEMVSWIQGETEEAKTGLGLRIVKELAGALEAHIKVQLPPRGTAVALHFRGN